MTASTLQQHISERIQRQGPITFAEYMRMALYEPDHGYYVTGQARIGWEGDYYTSTDVADFFAHCAGRQLQRIWEELGGPQPFLVVEQGAGRRDLATTIQTWTQQEAPAFAAALDYRTEDSNTGQDALAPQEQETELQQDGAQGTHEQAALPGGKAQAPAAFLSNELVDAFPVHVVQKQGEELYEIYVDLQAGRLVEAYGEPSSPDVASYLDSYKIPWRTYPDGWRAEINLDALQWVRRTAQRLGPRGFILAIDYGDSAQQLYVPGRPAGTLNSYYQHQLTDRPLARPGEQDITAHVNFTALIEEGRRQGLALQTFTTQREWLTSMGIYEEMERIRSRDFAVIDTDRGSDRGQVAMLQWYNLRQRVAALTEPGGMGNFKVLILKR